MADVTVKALQNGRYEVGDGAKALDHMGKEYAEKRH